MAKALDSKEIATTDEIARANMVAISALIELLVEKGIITQADLMERCKKLRAKIRGE